MSPTTSSGKVRIVRIIARLNVGGPALQTILLTRGLDTNRFSSRLVTGSVSIGEGDMTPYALEQEVHPVILPELGREISVFKDLLVFWKLVKILKLLQPHIVHTHTAKAGTLGRLAAWVAEVPVKIHTFHGHVFEGYFQPAQARVFIWIERALALITDRLVVLSERQRKDLVETYRIAPRKKFQIVPLGFDLTSFVALPAPAGLRRAAQPPTFGFVGRLVSIKNPLLLLEAFRLLLTDVRSSVNADSSHFALSTLWFIGSGPLENSLRQVVQKYGLGSQITFWGWQQDLAKFYRDIDVIVLSSLNEGTPVVLIEAMASHKPFIATDVGGVRDLMVGHGQPRRDEKGRKFTLFDNGILVQSGDAHGLAGAMWYMLGHAEQRFAMGRVGREFALGHFRREQLLADIQKLYEEMLHEKGIYVPVNEIPASAC